MTHPLVLLLVCLVIFLIFWLSFRPLQDIDYEKLEGDDRQTFPSPSFWEDEC